MIVINKTLKEPQVETTYDIGVDKGVPNKFVVLGLLDEKEMADPGFHAVITVSQSFDPEGIAWDNVPLTTINYKGGFPGRNGVYYPPFFYWESTGKKPEYVKVTLDYDKEASIGVDLTIG